MRVMREQLNDDIDSAYSTVQAMEAELVKSVHIEKFDRMAMLAALATGSHVLMDGVYGTGKTETAKAMGSIFGGTFGRIQGTPDVMPSDITGSLFFNMKTQEYEFIKGPVFSNVVLADELQRMAEKSQSGLMEAMQEGQVTPAGSRTSHKLPEPFLLIATRNPDGLPLEGGIVDRLAVGIQPQPQTSFDRKAIAAKKKSGHVAEPVVSPRAVLDLQEVIETQVVFDDAMEDVANELIDRVYNHERIDHTESIEGGFRSFWNILNVAKFVALHRKNRVVDAQDVAFAAPAVLAHRITLDYEAQDQGLTSRKVIESAIADMNLPRPD